MREKSSRHLKKRTRKINAGAVLTSVLIILLSGAAIGTGLALPGTVSAIQSRNVDRLETREELGTGLLSLTSDDAKIERLRIISTLHYSGEAVEAVQIGDGRFTTEPEAEQALFDVFKICENTGLYMGNPQSWRVTEAFPVLLIPRDGEMASILVWLTEAELREEESFFHIQAIVDDSTALVLAFAFESDGGAEGIKMSILKTLAANLEEYYDFTDTQLTAPDSEEVAYSGSYGSSFIYCLRDGETVFEIPAIITPEDWQIGGPWWDESSQLENINPGEEYGSPG